jgi:hypothetical protein
VTAAASLLHAQSQHYFLSPHLYVFTPPVPPRPLSQKHTHNTEDLPPLVLPPIEYPGILAPSAKDININSQIMDTYLHNILAGQ